MQTNFIIKNKNPRIKSLGDNITSHHTMSTQPSGTDLNTLREEANERNCFVSLIVNHAGTYYAAITRKVQTKSEITIKNLGTSYEFFGEGSKEISKDNTETTKTIDKEYIEYFDLEVERHEVTNSLSYLDDRFEEIEQKKAQAKTSQSRERCLPWNGSDDEDTFHNWLHKDDRNSPKELTLFDNETPRFISTKEGEDYPEDIELTWTPDPKKIHKALCQIITCNLILNPDKFDLKQWITKHMVNMYKRIFGEESVILVEQNYACSFDEWRDFAIQFTLDHFDMDDVPDAILEQTDLFQSKVANAIAMELKPYIKMNVFLEDYYTALDYNILE